MLANNIIRQFVSQIIGLICGLSISIITARILGPEGRGDFSLILNASSFLCLLLGFSFGTSIVHVISANKMPQRNTINTFVIVIFCLSVICFLFLLFFPFSNFSFFMPADYPQNQFFYPFILFSLFIISLYQTLFSSVLNGNRLFLQQQKSFIFISILSTVLYLLLFFLKTRLQIGAHEFLIFYIAISFLPVFGCFYMYVNYARPVFSTSLLDLKQFKYVINFSLLAYLCNVFQFLSYRMDFWIVEYFKGSKELGIYSLSVNLAQMIWILPTAISTILLSYSGAESKEKSIQNIKVLCRVALFLIFIASLILALTIQIIIPVLYGREFEESILLFRILLLGILPFSITTILASYFAGTGQMKVNFICSFIGFLVCLIFDLILIPDYGTVGAGIATGIAYISSTIFILFVFLNRTNSKLNEMLILKKEDVNLLRTKLNSLRSKKD